MRVVAVDLGASSGRVFVADVGDDGVSLAEVARFANEPVAVGPTLHWDVLGLYRGVLDGIRAAGPDLASIGIDSWGVDYGLLRADGSLLANPVTYRDDRTEAVRTEIVERAGADALYARSGIALLRINTLYQLVADARAGHLDGADCALLIPDLLGYFLTGERGVEVTNASTTQLLGVDGTWDADLMSTWDIPAGLFGHLVQPGAAIGPTTAAVSAELGFDTPVPVTATASHDTAAAVVAVPASTPDFAYISCGTWSLVGLELERPVVSPQARRAGFTNERGIDGTTRFLRNVMGLWLLQQSVRTWGISDLDDLLAAAAEVEPLRWVIDPDDDAFLAPGDLPARIRAACGDAAPTTPPEVTRCILDSLAVAYRRSLHDACALAGRTVDVVHLVGGGVRNRLLAQLTADACGRPVVAGPVEAAALGNALVQARALGLTGPDRWALRRLVPGGVTTYEPRPALTTRFAEATLSR